MDANDASIRLSLDAGASGSFLPVGEYRTCLVTFRMATLDIKSVHLDKGWRGFLKRNPASRISGVLSVSDDGAANVLATVFKQSVVQDWQLAVTELGMLQGLFLVSDFLNENGALCRLTLTAAGEIRFLEGG